MLIQTDLAVLGPTAMYKPPLQDPGPTGPAVGNPPSTNPVTFEKLHALLLMLCVSVLSFLQERLLAAPSRDDAAHMDHMDPSSHIAGHPTSRRGMVRASGWWCHMC